MQLILRIRSEQIKKIYSSFSSSLKKLRKRHKNEFDDLTHLSEQDRIENIRQSIKYHDSKS